MKCRITLLLIHLVFISFGQTVLNVDRTSVVIGDQIKATLTTNLADGREWRNVGELWPDSIPGIVVVSGPEIDNKNPASVRYTWNVSVFDTGIVRIPPLMVVIRQGNNLDTTYTIDIPIQVKSIEPDSTGLAGIKDVVKQPFSLVYYKKYLPHLLIVLIILAGLYFWWKRRNKKQDVVEAPKPEPLPHEWALLALDDLESKRLWQSGEVKEHYTLLTSILREYLERLFSINALEQTTVEILEQLKKQNLSNDLLVDTEELLSVADLIKFAKADPGIDLHAATIERVRRFVRETMVMATKPDPVIDLKAPDETVE